MQGRHLRASDHLTADRPEGEHMWLLGVRPDPPVADLAPAPAPVIGAAVCLRGVAVIMYRPRAV